MTKFLFAVLLLVALPLSGMAQERVFVQIAARSNLGDALLDLQRIARRVPGLGGYRMNNGWYALAIGPFDQASALSERARLISAGQIPGDSFLAVPSDFRRQFWPPGENALAAAPVTVSEPEAEVEIVAALDETRNQARASERRLDRGAREDLQRALAWFGHYSAAIDGDIGPGSRRAMSAWQVANAQQDTGVLTTRQRALLMETYTSELTALGLASRTDEAAGIVIDMPSGQVSYDRTEAPFVHYEGQGENPARVVLISQSGDRARLNSLFKVMKTLAIVPKDASATLRRSSFVIEGAGRTSTTYVEARLANDEIKGFALIWPDHLPGNATRIAGAMWNGYSSIEGVALPEDAGATPSQDVDLMAGLAIRRPAWVRSGIFLDDRGHVLTPAEGLESCSHITLGDDVSVRADTIATNAEFAMLSPIDGASPIGFATFSDAATRIGSDIIVSGFAYGGRLGSPTMTLGTVADTRGLDNEPGISRLSLARDHNGAGGPILDTTGAVIGMLQDVPSGALIPKGTRTAFGSETLVAAIEGAGVPVVLDEGFERLDVVDLATRAADITAMVACWKD